MKILHITQGYSPGIGGTEWLIQRVSEELVRNHGDEVTVFTTNCYNGEAFFKPRLPRLPVGWEMINGVRVRRFPVRSRISQYFGLPQALAYRLRLPFNEYLRALARGPVIFGLTRAIEEYPADVITASSFPLLHMFAAQRAAEKSRRPCVLVGGLHPEDAWGFQRPMIYRTIRKATHYVAYTQFEADYVIKRGALPQRVSVIGVGVDPERFVDIPPVEAKRRLALEGKPVVGFIGQLGGHKGVDTLIRAMPYVWKELPEARLLIAGARTIFADYLESMIHQWSEGDQNKVILRYDFAEEDKPWLFAAADVVAYPSGYESFGIAYLEAWASGKPVIGCRRGAIPWVVDAGRDGLLVEYQRHKMLAEAILLLLNNPRWAEAMGNTGQRKVLERFTWQSVAQQFRQVYLALLKEEGQTTQQLPTESR